MTRPTTKDRAGATGQPGRRTLRVNGRERVSAASTVAELLAELGHPRDARGVAVALNDAVVPRSRWDEPALRAGDRVEIVGAVQGG